ncbi:hypothetical protein A2311_04815 [candidate division WOR-1 bacterium RIFOXYB2_FULL_48_7]|uniref:Transcription elongation factor GreA n=1 Tax=candidate division WOR-1 bacterium RIFOXYB2_FULL_48_7 TaxID=1802583 RepID=A0A1F4TW60_UNCSA|nr:MAG: hypothetical protein A2311_04815 [candidate division WOR-1 bacterium RIFOXYB2_FULL_48_7]
MGNYLTKEAWEKLTAKLEELKARRGIISKTIGEAREHGDLRENSAYHAAKEEQGLNEMRIKELEAQLNSATVVEAKDLPGADEVFLGSTVKMEDLDSGRQVTYMLVSEMEADILEDKISPSSPVGAELMGRKKGDIIEVEVPRGTVRYKVVDVRR